MVDAHQNLNGLRDLTKPLSGMVCYHQPIYQIRSLYLHSLYEDMKGDTKCQQWGGLR